MRWKKDNSEGTKHDATGRAMRKRCKQLKHLEAQGLAPFKNLLSTSSFTLFNHDLRRTITLDHRLCITAPNHIAIDTG